MRLRYRGLDPETFRGLFALSEAELSARHIVKQAADPGSPCRVSLEDALPGESVLLLPFVHQAAATPYRGTGAIFVRQSAVEAYDSDVPPPVFQTRTLSLRAYDGTGMMVEADLCEGPDVATACARLLGSAKTAYIHAHYAKYGCYGAKVTRA